MGRSATTTVLFSDIVGSTGLLGRLGEQAWDDVRREHFSVLRSVLADHAGTEVKNTGDGILAVFESARVQWRAGSPDRGSGWVLV